MSFQAELAQFQAGNGASNIARPVLQDLQNFVLPIFIVALKVNKRAKRYYDFGSRAVVLTPDEK